MVLPRYPNCRLFIINDNLPDPIKSLGDQLIDSNNQKNSIAFLFSAPQDNLNFCLLVLNWPISRSSYIHLWTFPKKIRRNKKSSWLIWHRLFNNVVEHTLYFSLEVGSTNMLKLNYPANLRQNTRILSSMRWDEVVDLLATRYKEKEVNKAFIKSFS